MARSTLKYRLVSMRHPGGKQAFLRGCITQRDVYDLKRVVEIALESGHVRGQPADVIGAFNGVIETVQDLCRQGKWINLGEWMRIHGELTGPVDEETRLPGPANRYRIVITPLSDLGCTVDSFDWERVGADARCVQVSSVASVGGGAEGTLVKGKDILVTGQNLTFDPKLGDNVACWVKNADGSSWSADIVPKESDAAHMLFAWNPFFGAAEAGTKFHMAFYLHGGVAGATRQRVYRTLKFVDP